MPLLSTLGFVMPLWISFHLSGSSPFGDSWAASSSLAKAYFCCSPVFSLFSALIYPHDFTAYGWLPNQYRGFSPHLYWIQISLFNHCLIRSLGSLLGTWPEMKLWLWLFKITFSISVKVPPPILFKPYIWKSFTLPHSLSQLSLFLPIHLSATLKIWSVTSISMTPAYSPDISHLHDSNQCQFASLLAPFSTSSLCVIFQDVCFFFHILTHLKLEYILQSVDGILKLHWFCFSFSFFLAFPILTSQNYNQHCLTFDGICDIYSPHNYKNKKFKFR